MGGQWWSPIRHVKVRNTISSAGLSSHRLDRDDARLSIGDRKRWPARAFEVTGELDPAADHGCLFAQRLRADGTDARLARYPRASGTPGAPRNPRLLAPSPLLTRVHFGRALG